MITVTDKLATISSDVVSFLNDEPELLEHLEPFLVANQWSPDNPPTKIQVLIDSLVVAEYGTYGDIEIKGHIPNEFKTYEIQFDDETVLLFVQVNNRTHEIINRLQHID